MGACRTLFMPCGPLLSHLRALLSFLLLLLLLHQPLSPLACGDNHGRRPCCRWRGHLVRVTAKANGANDALIDVETGNVLHRYVMVGSTFSLLSSHSVAASPPWCASGLLQRLTLQSRGSEPHRPLTRPLRHPQVCREVQGVPTRPRGCIPG
jgi:hypothetical protein